MTEAKATEIDISKNLNRLMLKRRVSSVAELSKKTGIPRTTINFILSKSTSNPRIDTLLKLANFFQVSLLELLGLDSEKYVKEKIKLKNLEHVEKKLIPLISLKDAPSWRETPEWILTQKNQRWIPVANTVDEKSFASTIETENRFIFQKNSIIIVTPLKEYNAGDYLVVSIRKNNPTIRRLTEDSGVYYLIPSLHGAPAEHFNDQVTVFGKITENRIIL